MRAGGFCKLPRKYRDECLRCGPLRSYAKKLFTSYSCRRIVWPQPPPVEMMLELHARWQQQQQQQESDELAAPQPSNQKPARSIKEVQGHSPSDGETVIYCQCMLKYGLADIVLGAPGPRMCYPSRLWQCCMLACGGTYWQRPQ